MTCAGCKYLEKTKEFFRCDYHSLEIYNPENAGCDNRNKKNKRLTPANKNLIYLYGNIEPRIRQRTVQIDTSKINSPIRGAVSHKIEM